MRSAHSTSRAGFPRPHNTPLTALIAEDRGRPLNPGEPIKFNTTLHAQPVVTRSAVPMYDSCRELQSRGITGRVEFADAVTGRVRMTMDVEAGAKLTVEESPSGPVVRKIRVIKAGEPMASGRKQHLRTELAEVLS